MKLTLEQIKSITLGAVDIREEDGLINFCRFFPEQMRMYKQRSLDFYQKAHATAGMQFRFRTNSKTLSMKILTQPCSRNYFSVDVFTDDRLVGSMDAHPHRYLGEFSSSFSLGEGEKTVTVHLPWSVVMKLEEMTLEDGALLVPVRPSKTLLMYGDSITRGYDAKKTFMRYATKLAAFLDAEEQNRAIGGEIYHAELAQLEGPMTPDYVSIAYGTNDWGQVTREAFTEQCGAFIKTVSEKYPQAQIFVLTPIWRKNYQEEKPFGPFEEVEKCICRCCMGLSNVQVVRGFNLVPRDAEYFYDEGLHPNDAGFIHYADNLCKEIARLIEN